MEIHKDCKKRLLEELVRYLPGLTVSNNKYLNYKSTYRLLEIDKILPSSGELIKKYFGMIDETPFYTFITEEMQRKLKDYEYKLDEKDKNYLELISEFDYNSFATKLISDFEKLPKDYKLFIKLPEKLNTLLKYYDNTEIVLNDELKIIKLNDDFILNNNIKTVSKEVVEGIFKFNFTDYESDHNYLDKDKLYLELTAKGYIGDYYSTETVLNSLNVVKYFFGLGLARSVFKYKRNYNSSQSNRIKVFCKINDDWEFNSYHDLSYELNESISNIELSTAFHPNENINKDFYVSNIQLLGKIVSNHSVPEKIFEASKWFFEGHSGDNELLSFIQNTVVLEILLGDKSKSDIIGISELLRNRCAYLISNSVEEREKILKDFNNIYEIRSQIVHRGKSKLYNDERELLGMLRYFCSRVINKEISFLKI